jgi:hypothetical protein
MAKQVNRSLRPLNDAGLAIWSSVPRPAAPVELELLQQLCEQVDERTALRALVIAEGDSADRRALRDLETSIAAGFARLQVSAASSAATTREQRLLAARDQLAVALTTETDSTKRAVLSREYRLVLDRIEELMPATTESKIDELANRRADRNTVTSNRKGARPRQSG